MNRPRNGRGLVIEADAVVVGSGVAGLTAALGLSPRRVVLLTKTGLVSGSSTYAQGGIAAAVGADDSPELHAADTLAASSGLADPEAVAEMTMDGPRYVEMLVELGTRFDRDSNGQLQLGREGAHSRRRILHAGGDATGAEIVRALTVGVGHAPTVDIHEYTFASDLVLDGGRVCGVVAHGLEGPMAILAPAVVLATGGLGHLYLYTTNPDVATGDGHALAARAGILLADMEFVQFHPTALDVAALGRREKGELGAEPIGAAPVPLLTEALRGEGAFLVDETGERFMIAHHPLADLAPRDVVARAIWRRQLAGHEVYLDARQAVGSRFPTRFPTVYEACRERGVDPRTDPMPVSPAAHFCMGGIAVDSVGHTSKEGLWACGEVAASGVHGANRLASNSLLEALVFGARVAESIRRGDGRAIAPLDSLRVADRSRTGIERWFAAAALQSRERQASPANGHAARLVAEIRRLAWDHLGLVRDETGLMSALERLRQLEADLPDLPATSPRSSGEARNLATVATLIATAALARTESRGAHYRSDFPTADERWERRLYLTGVAEGGSLRLGTVSAPSELDSKESITAPEIP